MITHLDPAFLGQPGLKGVFVARAHGIYYGVRGFDEYAVATFKATTKLSSTQARLFKKQPDRYRRGAENTVFTSAEALTARRERFHASTMGAASSATSSEPPGTVDRRRRGAHRPALGLAPMICVSSSTVRSIISRRS